MLSTALLTCAQVVELDHDLVHVGPNGHTYRIYATFPSAGDQLTALFASSAFPAEALADSGFFQHPLGGPSSAEINETLAELYPSLLQDSWFTIDAENNSSNTLQSAGSTDWQTGVSAWEAGDNWLQNGQFGGSYFVLPTGTQGTAGDDLQVLVAQWTVKSAVSSTWNIQWRPSGSPVSEELTGLVLNLPLPAGCTEPEALNYLPHAALDDGTCIFPDPGYIGLSFEDVSDQLGTPDSLGKSWRIYADFEHANDEVTSVFGTAEHPLVISSTSAFHQSSFGGPTPDLAAQAMPSLPETAWDSWFTIGASSAPSGVQFVGLETAEFESGEALVSDSAFGGSWFVYPGQAPEAAPDSSGRVLLAQLTTKGIITAQVNLQYRSYGIQNVLVYDAALSFPEAITGCLDSLACNFNPEANLSDTCTYPIGPLYGCNGLCLEDDDNDGICNANETLGCADELACNFDALATDDDGTCYYEDGVYDCNGECYGDYDNDGICDPLEVAGCAYSEACNYQPEATDDDGSCLFAPCGPAPIEGCTYSEASNYLPEAEVDNGLCAFALAYDLESYSPSCRADLNLNGSVGIDDLLTLLSLFTTYCNL